MTTSEKVVPDWVWKRRWSRNWARSATIVYGLFVGSIGLVILIAAFETRLTLSDICPSYTGCPVPNFPGSPLYQAMSSLGLVITPLATGLLVAGFILAFNTWRVKEWEWAAMFGIQPLAKRLEYLYSQGKITKQEVDDIIKSLMV